MRLYLAHTLGLRDWVAEEIFPKIPKEFEIVDPFASRRKTLDGMGDNEETIRKKIAESFGETPRWIVTHDLDEVKTCDAMLTINSGGPSYGSSFESFYMSHELGRPVFFVTSQRYKLHPWLLQLCCCVTDDVDQAIESLKKYYGI